jgi:hypothetical protein
MGLLAEMDRGGSAVNSLYAKDLSRVKTGAGKGKETARVD